MLKFADQQIFLRRMYNPGSNDSPDKSPFIKIVLMVAGLLAAMLGIVGIFIPLLPTTPFLLLASWCFVRSSDKLNKKLTGNRFLGPYIKNYREKNGITQRNKIYSLVLLWITLFVSFLLSPSFWWLWIVLLSVGVGVSYHIISFKTLGD